MTGDTDRRRGELEHDLLGNGLNRPCQVHFALRDRRFGKPGRPSEECTKPLVGHSKTADVVEIALIEPEASVLLDVNQVLLDQVCVHGLSVRSEAHQLVLAGVHPEPREIGEGGIQHADRMREPNLLEQLDAIALAFSDGRRRPFTDPIHGENRRLFEG